MDHVKIVGQGTHQNLNKTPVRVDEEAQALTVMGEIHTRIHRGQFFSFDFIADKANDAYIDTLIRVAVGGSIHLRVTGAAAADAELYLHEDVTADVDGSAGVIINRNRFSGNTPGTLLFTTPTISNTGTALMGIFMPGGTGGNAGGSGASSFEEFILAPGDHLVRLINRGGSEKTLFTQLDFYEPTQEPS